MAGKKPSVVIVGAGMAGITAAHRLHTSAPGLFDLCVVEAGDRIGGRIFTSEFAGRRVEVGATWIHGIEGSPVFDIAQKIHALHAEDRRWERMDGSPVDPIIVAEGGFKVDSTIVSSISSLYTGLMDSVSSGRSHTSNCASVGSYLRRGLHAHLASCNEGNGGKDKVAPLGGEWTREALQKAVFAIHESTERIYTSADDLETLNLATECEYREFPGEQITIPKGYARVVEFLAAALPPGAIRLGTKVQRIEWSPDGGGPSAPDGPVRLHLADGTVVSADHVVVTVSLGVLKAGLLTFEPSLPSFKQGAIGRLGFGLVNKLFLEREESEEEEEEEEQQRFPFLGLAFDQEPGSGRQVAKIPCWMRRTASICPIYAGSRVLLAWFSGPEAMELETLDDETIIRGVHATLDAFSTSRYANHYSRCNGSIAGPDRGGTTSNYGRITRVMSSKWRSDPLFMGSYSYVAVGSSGDDLDLMAEPLPSARSHNVDIDGDGNGNAGIDPPLPLQILFAGEATHRTHYSTTHGAYFSGIREAERLLQHYLNAMPATGLAVSPTTT